MSGVPPDAAALEALRRGLDLSLDAEGRWWHEGEPFTHPGVTAAFDRGLDLHPVTREPILRVGDQWCYVRCADVPFVVRQWRLPSPEDPELKAVLNTGATVVVDTRDGLTTDASGHLYVLFGASRRARVGRSAQAALAPWLVERDGVYGLELPNGGPWRVTGQ